MNLSLCRRAAAAVVSFSLVASCPGLAPYAAAQSLRAASSARTPISAASGIPAVSAGSFALPSLMPSALGLSATLGAPSAPTPAAAAPLALALSPISAAAAPLAAAPYAAAVPAVAVSAKTVSAAAAEISAALELAGPVERASAGAASGLGRRLEDALTGALSPLRASLTAAPAVGDHTSNPHQLARPAGDSIREAAAASTRDADLPSVPPADAPAPRGTKGPFWPRLLSAALALAPAVFLGLPLLSASAFVVGGLVVATSVSLAIMPFLDESSPEILRAAPGLTLGALGLAVVGASISLFFSFGIALAPALLVSGTLAILGGWGLTRYGLGKSEQRYVSYGSIKTLSAFFGGLAAMTGVALAASTPLGWMAAGLLLVTYPLAALLWSHLPGWVGKGLGSALEGAWLSIHGLSRVLTSIHRDTVLLDRLQTFSERHWNSSKWNGVWLALIWGPLLLGEAAMYVLSAAGGLVIGAITAPVNFLWGASAKLWPKSKVNVYFAEAARFVFDNVQNGKVARFNPLAVKLIPFANSPKFLVRSVGALGLRVLQAGWLVYSLVAAPLLSIAGLLLAFGRLGSYEERRHKPGYRRINQEDSPSKKPAEPTEPAPGEPSKTPILPKLIAAALALVPAYFFGLPVLAGGSLMQIPLYLGLVLSLAAMPFLGKAPYWMKSLAGRALLLNGLVLLLTGAGILAGVVALLGGWGFGRWVKKTQEKGGSFDSAELGAFFGALGAAAAVGAVWAGFFGGWIGWGTLIFAGAVSPFLLRHLPSWVWSGVLGSLRAVGKSVVGFYDVAAFWSEDTQFRSNMGSHASYWLKKTYWNGVWLSAIWVPTGLIQAAEIILSSALGLVIGLLRAPFGFAAAAFEKAAPEGKAARFFRSLHDGWRNSAEGSKAFFDRLVSGLKPAMDEAAATTGRPTVKAAGAFLLARFLQLAWLAGVLVMNLSGAAFVVGLVRGIRAAFGSRNRPENG